MYRPDYVLVNYDSGTLVGTGDEAEVREQLKKISQGNSAANADAFLIAKVEVMSAMRRVET